MVHAIDRNFRQRPTYKREFKYFDGQKYEYLKMTSILAHTAQKKNNNLHRMHIEMSKIHIVHWFWMFACVSLYDNVCL